MSFQWTPEQIGRLDPDYVDELVARMKAENRKAKPGPGKKGRRKGR